MKAWLYVGAKVIWVGGGSKGCAKNPGSKPQRGVVYTIRGLRILPLSGRVVVLLEEIQPGVFTENGEVGWCEDNFRPISTINTDAAVANLAKLTLPADRKATA